MSPESTPVPFDAAWAKRMADMTAAADQRPSAGVALVDSILSFKKGVFEDERFPDEKARRELLVVPLMVRESRTFWLRPVAKGEEAHAPDCKSVNGLVPVPADPRAGPLDDVLQPQAKTCAECPWNKFDTADNGGGGKKCKTGGNLFGLEVTPAGEAVGSILVRYSASNSQVNRAIDLADRKGSEAKLVRCLSVWELGSGKGTFSGGDYAYMSPTFKGPAPKALYGAIESSLQGLMKPGVVDSFLGGGTVAAGG